MIQYKHAKLLRQCVLRNRLSRERMTAPADTYVEGLDPSMGGGGAIWSYFVHGSRHVGLHRHSNCIYILTMPCVDNIHSFHLTSHRRYHVVPRPCLWITHVNKNVKRCRLQFICQLAETLPSS